MVIQNQTVNYPLRWDKTGVIIKAKGFNQYQVMTHGSQRVTLRNRKFLRKINHPIQRFTYQVPHVTPSLPKRSNQPPPQPRSCPQTPSMPPTPISAPIGQEASTPNQEEPLPTPKQSPPIRANQRHFDEQMNVAQGSPTTALPPPVASPTLPLPAALPDHLLHSWNLRPRRPRPPVTCQGDSEPSLGCDHWGPITVQAWTNHARAMGSLRLVATKKKCG